jgi:hypothetical protein
MSSSREADILLETDNEARTDNGVYVACPECADESPRFAAAPEGVEHIAQWWGGHTEACPEPEAEA